VGTYKPQTPLENSPVGTAQGDARSIWPSSGWRTTAHRAGPTTNTPSNTTSTSKWTKSSPNSAASFGAQPDAQLAESLPPEVREAVTFGRPV